MALVLMVPMQVLSMQKRSKREDEYLGSKVLLSDGALDYTLSVFTPLFLATKCLYFLKSEKI